ncbi:MAG TPA: hypothetical protein VFN99_00330 [Gaiella sp.]|nr:hypothetical protein [Gaiella sp.]
MEWAQAATIIAANTAVVGLVVGLQTFWISRSLDALRSEMHRSFDRVETRLDRLEGREPPSLRQV